MSFLRRFWPCAVLFIAAALPLWRCFAFGDTVGAFDSIRQMAPWNGPASARPWDVLQADSVLQFFGWRDMVLESWGHGKVPFWNPYELAGTPLLGNSQSAGLYPPHMVLGLLHVPTSTAVFLLAWFHLLVSGVGTYFFARRLGATKIGATTAGISFALSPFMLAWTSLASVTTTVCWIPWLFGFLLWIYQDRAPTRLRGVLGLAISFVLMLLGGHLQFAAYGAIFALVAILTLSITERRFGPALLCVLGLGIGSALAAPQILPAMSYSKFSHRSNVPDAKGYEKYSGAATEPRALAMLAFPTAEGNPANTSSLGNGVNAYWPSIAKPGTNFAEDAIGLGPVVFVLLVLGFLRRPRGQEWLPVIIGAISLLLAIGTPLNRLLFFGIPGWSASGSPGRVGVLFVLSACVLAGLAVRRIGELASDRLKWGVAAASTVAVMLAALLSSASVPDLTSRGIDLAKIASSALVGELPVILATLGLAIAGIVAYRMAPSRYAWAVPAAAAAAAVVGYGLSLVPTGAPLGKVPGPLQERIAVINDKWELLVPMDALLPPNTAGYSRIHELGGYDSLLHRDTVALLGDIDGGDPATLTNGNMMFVKTTASAEKLSEAGVTEVWSKTPLDSFGNPTSSSADVFKYNIPSKGRAYTPSAPAAIVEEDYSHLTVDAVGPGPLVVKDRNMPGWEVQIDGQPSKIEAGPWRTVALAAGRHRVRFDYVAPGYSTGLQLFSIGAFGSLLLCLLAWKSSKNRRVDLA